MHEYGNWPTPVLLVVAPVEGYHAWPPFFNLIYLSIYSCVCVWDWVFGLSVRSQCLSHASLAPFPSFLFLLSLTFERQNRSFIIWQYQLRPTPNWCCFPVAGGHHLGHAADYYFGRVGGREGGRWGEMRYASKANSRHTSSGGAATIMHAAAAAHGALSGSVRWICPLAPRWGRCPLYPLSHSVFLAPCPPRCPCGWKPHAACQSFCPLSLPPPPLALFPGSGIDYLAPLSSPLLWWGLALLLQWHCAFSNTALKPQTHFRTHIRHELYSHFRVEDNIILPFFTNCN